MNMHYEIGQFVGYVSAADRRLAVPLPQLWYILKVTPGRDGKVMQAFWQRNISAYRPTIVRTVDRRTGAEARRPHLGKTIIKAFLPGLIFLPDFELDNLDEIESVDDVEGLLQVGPCLARLKVEEMQVVRLLSQAYNVPLGQRKYALHQLVRITDGPMAGLVGQIERLDSNGRLKVFLDAVMRGVSADVAETQIEPVVARKRVKADRHRARL